MNPAEIRLHRLNNQQISETIFSKPHEIVEWFGAMQAQDFAMAKWAIGLRLPGLNVSDVEQSFNEGLILRTHVLRPTWHFVTPRDIRWMLRLTAPRVHSVNASMYRKLSLVTKVFARSIDIFIKALQGGKQETRTILKTALDRGRINADGLRLGYILMYAELEGIICSGARIGKQFTYSLLDDRAPGLGSYHEKEALAELTRRYFLSRGPATLKDFAWWSGLTLKQVNEGIGMLKAKPAFNLNQSNYYFIKPTKSKSKSILKRKTELSNSSSIQPSFLLPDYDEYGISYKDRSAIFTKKNVIIQGHGGNILFNHMLVIDGIIEGTWQRRNKNKKVIVETAAFGKLNKAGQHAVKQAVNRYQSFFEES